MTTATPLLPDRHTRSALRALTALVAAYLGLSVATLVVIVVLKDNPAIVNLAAWIRGSFAVANAILLFVFARRAAVGVPRAFLRVRIISVVVLAAIVVIISLPGTFPLWLRLEQAACGLLLLAVVIVTNRRKLRTFFATR
jgi:hypothetical protein